MYKIVKKMATLLLCLMCFVSCSQSTDNHSGTLTEIINQSYEELIHEEDVIGASIAIIDNGKIVYANGFGFSDRKNNIKATSETIYRIGSSTKTFTALAVMQLHEKKLLNINESIKKYIPEIQIENRFNDNNEIFIKDILSHVSGLPSDIYNGFFAHSVPDITWLIEELNKQTTISPNQYSEAYSNIGYGLLGELIYRVSGISYDDYIKQFIFNPLQMHSSSVGLNTEILSKAYVNNKEFKVPLIRDKAAGSITSNVLDMANFINMFLQDGEFNNNVVISKEQINKMEEDKLSSISLHENHTTYGFGMQRNTISIKGIDGIKKGTLIGHGGDIIAFHGDYKYIPELNVGAVILTNTDNGYKINDADELLKLYLKKAKGISFDRIYTEPRDNDVLLTNDELKGAYNFGDAIMEVNGADKIKFKMDGTKVVLKRKKGTNRYSFKLMLLGFIPIKSDDIEIKFEKVGDDIYVKQVDVEKNREEYVAKKITKNNIPPVWKEKYGVYKIINKVYDCSNCLDWNYKNATVKIFEENGFVVFVIEGENESDDLEGMAYLNILSDTLAVTGGLGRDSSETIRILGNGNIYYSGFELSKN